MPKLKKKKDNNKISLDSKHDETHCKQYKDDVLLEFGCITSHDGYSFDALRACQRNHPDVMEQFMDLVITISKSNWKELGSRGKRTKGGFETLYYSELHCSIVENYWKETNKKFSKDKKIHVFRFGSGDRYRMIGYKSNKCSRAFHILAFDLDHSLYNHGN